MVIIPRSDWAGDRGPVRPARMGVVRYAVVHHTVLGAANRPDEVPSALRRIRDLHVDENGWDDMGYNLVVDPFGRVWEGRAGGVGAPVVGAHAHGHNAESTGIALLGDWSERRPPRPALEAARQLIAFKLGLHGLAATPDTVRPHCALAGTACPGRVPVAWLGGAGG